MYETIFYLCQPWRSFDIKIHHMKSLYSTTVPRKDNFGTASPPAGDKARALLQRIRVLEQVADEKWSGRVFARSTLESFFPTKCCHRI